MQTGHLSDRAARVLFTGSASTAILIVVLIFVFIGINAVPFFQAGGSLTDLFGKRWAPISMVEPGFGILPLLMGSIVVTAIATLVAVPFGVIGAIYLAELARPLEREIIKPFIELLAGIPSVVIGFFGLVVLAPIVKAIFNLDTGLNGMTGALLLALMAIPTILTVSEDAIRNVPTSYKQASMALGATRVQTIFRVSVPASYSGIFAAVMLGIGRVVGETMTVLMVTGNAAQLTWNPFAPLRTMTATIALETGETIQRSQHYAALFCIGIVLLIMTFMLNMIAMRVLRKFEMREQ